VSGRGLVWSESESESGECGMGKNRSFFGGFQFPISVFHFFFTIGQYIRYNISK
jgi:hypothetical protein